MATLNSAAVTALASGFVRKSAYRGNVQCIPVVITEDATDGTHALVFSEVLPANTYVIGVNLETTAIGGTTSTIDIGFTGNADAIIDGESVASAGSVVYPGLTATAGAGGPIDVSGKQLIGELKGTMSTDSISGYILIVTDE
jgi:hypothetical protein